VSEVYRVYKERKVQQALQVQLVKKVLAVHKVH
jgi:hypothetical protein